MAVQGPYTWFNKAKKKIADGTIHLDTDTFKMVLTSSSQALTAAFTGTSTDCRYSDLTAELSTASGYTNGGATMTGTSLTLSSATVIWNANAVSWTLSASITFKYAIIYSNTATNKDLLCYADFDTGGGSVSPVAGSISINPGANGYLYWT